MWVFFGSLCKIPEVFPRLAFALLLKCFRSLDDIKKEKLILLSCHDNIVELAPVMIYIPRSITSINH